MPCAAASSSIADDVAPCCPPSSPRRRAAKVAMLTWSSWFAEVGRLSTLAGCASDLFSRRERRGGDVRDHEAGVHARRRATRNGGRPRERWRRSASRCAARRARRSRRSPAPARRRRTRPARRGNCRRRATSPVVGEDQRVVGDRVRLDSAASRAAWRIRSRQAPITCGWQRRLYGSCTRSSLDRCERADLAAGEQRAVDAGDVDLARLAAHARGCADRTARRCRARRRRDSAPATTAAANTRRPRTGRAAPARSRPACR